MSLIPPNRLSTRARQQAVLSNANSLKWTVLPLVRDRHRPGIARIGPTVIGYNRRPAGARRILIVGISAQPRVQFFVFGQFVSIQLHPKARSGGHLDRAIVVLERTAFNDVIGEMVIMRVGGERQIRQDRAQMEHGGELDAEFARWIIENGGAAFVSVSEINEK